MLSRDTENTSNNKSLRTRDDLTIQGLEELTSNITVLTCQLSSELEKHWLKPVDMKEALKSLQEVKIPENNSNILKKYTAVFRKVAKALYGISDKHIEQYPTVLKLIDLIKDEISTIKEAKWFTPSSQKPHDILGTIHARLNDLDWYGMFENTAVEKANEKWDLSGIMTQKDMNSSKFLTYVKQVNLTADIRIETSLRNRNIPQLQQPLRLDELSAYYISKADEIDHLPEILASTEDEELSDLITIYDLSNAISLNYSYLTRVSSELPGILGIPAENSQVNFADSSDGRYNQQSTAPDASSGQKNKQEPVLCLDANVLNDRLKEFNTHNLEILFFEYYVNAHMLNPQPDIYKELHDHIISTYKSTLETLNRAHHYMRKLRDEKVATSTDEFDVQKITAAFSKLLNEAALNYCATGPVAAIEFKKDVSTITTGILAPRGLQQGKELDSRAKSLKEKINSIPEMINTSREERLIATLITTMQPGANSNASANIQEGKAECTVQHCPSEKLQDHPLSQADRLSIPFTTDAENISGSINTEYTPLRHANENEQNQTYFQRHPTFKKVLLIGAIVLGAAVIVGAAVAAFLLTAGAATPASAAAVTTTALAAKASIATVASATTASAISSVSIGSTIVAGLTGLATSIAGIFGFARSRRNQTQHTRDDIELTRLPSRTSSTARLAENGMDLSLSSAPKASNDSNKVSQTPAKMNSLVKGALFSTPISRKRGTRESTKSSSYKSRY